VILAEKYVDGAQIKVRPTVKDGQLGDMLFLIQEMIDQLFTAI
jgi:hypothetical protein